MDKPSFQSIAGEHADLIERVLRSLRVHPNDVPDVAQEVFCAVHRRLPMFDPARAACPENAVRSWLTAICYRRAKCYHRARLRRNERPCDPAELDDAPVEVADNEQAYDACETGRLLFELLGTLSEERRDVLLAYVVEGIPMSDVARARDLPVNTAWNRLRLAREDLRAVWHRRVR